MKMAAERNCYSSEVTRLLGKTEPVSYAGRGRVENNRYPSKPSPSPSPPPLSLSRDSPCRSERLLGPSLFTFVEFSHCFSPGVSGRVVRWKRDPSQCFGLWPPPQTGL